LRDGTAPIGQRYKRSPVGMSVLTLASGHAALPS